MNLGQQKTVMIGGQVVDVENGGERIFSVGGVHFCSASGRGLSFNLEPIGEQIAYPVDSTHDLSMAGSEWMPLDGHK